VGGPRADEIEQVSQLRNKVKIGKFSGHVTVDGKTPPSQDGMLFVILNDPEHPKAGGKVCANCNEEGNFEFTTYLRGDGAPVGKYVLTFVQLSAAKPAARSENSKSGKSGGGGGMRAGGGGIGRVSQDYAGPDALKNLYSDPEKAKANPEFLVEIAEPGRTDYDFKLSLAGKEPVKTPGAYAATSLKVNNLLP
jgi:hypothetical protein